MEVACIAHIAPLPGELADAALDVAPYSFLSVQYTIALHHPVYSAVRIERHAGQSVGVIGASSVCRPRLLREIGRSPAPVLSWVPI